MTQPPAQEPYGTPDPQGARGPQDPSGVPAGETSLVIAIAHLGALLFGFIPALVVFLIYKDRDARIREESRQALNFNITMLLAAIALGIASGILAAITLGLLSFVTAVAYLPTVLVWVFGILAAVTYLKEPTGAREPYRYPLSYDFVK